MTVSTNSAGTTHFTFKAYPLFSFLQTSSTLCVFSQAQNMTKGMQQVQSQIDLRQCAEDPQSRKSDQHPLHLCTEV